MSKNWEDDDELTPDELENDEELDEEPIDDSSAAPSEKYEKLLGEDSKKYKLSGMFKDWFLDYSSYVILQRAVPHIVDGLKPVQRRVLHAMFRMDDGSYTKVANIVGQAMQYHPHGDASILGALVQLGQKGLLIDCQGNWGNILTGDSNAAPRYIEARLSKFAKEVVFDPKITNWMTSYDGRNQEPTELPVRFPLLLAQGTEGIAVGMASKILPHNFNELIDASVKILEGEDFTIYPDFPTGGSADCSNYKDGARGGSVKVRAKIEKIDKNTVAITEIPYGKTSPHPHRLDSESQGQRQDQDQEDRGYDHGKGRDPDPSSERCVTGQDDRRAVRIHGLRVQHRPERLCHRGQQASVPLCQGHTDLRHEPHEGSSKVAA